MAKTKRQTNPEPSKSRVLVVDDHPIVREGLARLIATEPDLEVCGAAASAHEAILAAERFHPDVAIVDLSLQGGGGLDLIRDLSARHPDLRILVLSMHDAHVYAERALRAGARGYVMKEEGTEKVIEGIRRVLRGEIYLRDDVAQRILSRLSGGTGRRDEVAVAKLTDRELEILNLIGQGLSTRQIAEHLHRSVKTIESHRAHIMEKLDIHGSRDLIQYAISLARGTT